MTWLDIDREHQATLIDAVTSVVMEQLGSNGYLGSCFATIGRRNYTFTAWENVELPRPRSAQAPMPPRCAWQKAGTGDNAFGVTSIWKPEVLNGVFHAGQARSGDLIELTGQWL